MTSLNMAHLILTLPSSNCVKVPCSAVAIVIKPIALRIHDHFRSLGSSINYKVVDAIFTILKCSQTIINLSAELDRTRM